MAPRCFSVLALQPAAPRPPIHHSSAAAIPDPPPVVEQFEPSFLDNVLLAAFRWTLQQQSNGPRSDLPGFEGMVQELIDFRQLYGLDEQERVSYQTLLALAGPVPFVYRQLFSSGDFSPAVLAWFAKHLLPFLVGEMELTERSQDDGRTGGVLVHRCRVLEGTNCKGVCAKMCKLPTQRFFAEEWGVPLSMTPNFETGQCQLAFGVEPLALEDDPTMPSGCLTRCPVGATPLASSPHETQQRAHETVDTC
ncbi:expressed unknown protein [Seminavis robusta]|uniref:Beta-carotene isomerase D27-like C-terminal domain-containing protein n=1 Tax=Seminavis robusta TaxID=568900 RepID=A0A9N8E7W3_9STRA|nr:expressed unknown protein [Seminavis robusta]|eukprot:Sro717_g192040.1 n/a (250) ;mRNA; r:35652-36401